jgi:hypothetical protein
VNPEPTYPVVRFLARHGVLVSWICGLFVLIAAMIAVALGAPVWLIFVSAFAAPLVAVFVRSYVEIVQIISEILLPR